MSRFDMNWRGTWTLFNKETWRFMKVITQTVMAPVITALLYLLIFQHLLEDHLEVYPGVGYGAFLVPGLVMMSMIQNAFSNASSSLIQSKQAGNIIFMLLAPLSAFEVWLAYVAAAVLRGLLVGLGVLMVSWWLVPITFAEPVWILVFALLGSVLMGTLGLLAGIWAEKYEHLAAFQNFIIVPLSFLSGVFYSIHSLPPLWAEISRYNPFFYMIDGFRYGFVGASDVSPEASLVFSLLATFALALLSWWLIYRGYKIRR